MLELNEHDQHYLTKITRVVFPRHVNHYHTLYGCTALKLIDEVGFLAASRFCRQHLVTARTGPIIFKEPIKEGSFVILEGRVSNTGKSSLTVQVNVYFENLNNRSKVLAIVGELVFVAIDEEFNTIKVAHNKM